MSVVEPSLPAERLGEAVDRLVRQAGHWQAVRWAAGASADGAGSSRADQVYALVQRLADAGAQVEGRARRVVPRLGDQVLPDQLRVMAHDLVATGAAEEVIAEAAGDVDAVRRRL